MDRTLARQAGLLIVVFLATLVLLVGGWAVVRESGRSPSTRPPGASGSGSIGSPVVSGSSGAGPSASAGAGASGGGSPGSGDSGGAGTTVVLTGAGDIADCGLSGAKDTSDLLIGQAGTIFTAGNNAYQNGSANEFAACYDPTWGRVKDRTLPAPGNRDYQTSGATGYKAYFGAASMPDGTTWYSTDLGEWHVIVLDSNCAQVGGCDPGSPQGRWLAADLRASVQTRCTVAIWHHPRFSSGEHGDDPAVGSFWEQLMAGHADLVIDGHDDDYERFAPQDASGHEDRKTGLREFVVGTGGAALHMFTHEAANSEFRLAGVWGVMRLTLQPANYDWEFLPTSGEITDSGSAPCH